MELIIAGLPRSATAWLSLYFGNPQFLIVHELSTYSMDKRADIMGAAGPDWFSRSLPVNHEMPTPQGPTMYEYMHNVTLNGRVPMILVQRNAADAEEDFIDFTSGLHDMDEEPLRDIFKQANDTYTYFAAHAAGRDNIFRIGFPSLFDPYYMEQLSEWLEFKCKLDTNRFSESWHEHMLSCNVGIEYPHVHDRVLDIYRKQLEA